MEMYPAPRNCHSPDKLTRRSLIQRTRTPREDWHHCLPGRSYDLLSARDPQGSLLRILHTLARVQGYSAGFLHEFAKSEQEAVCLLTETKPLFCRGKTRLGRDQANLQASLTGFS
jgi:hypothetical protein